MQASYKAQLISLATFPIAPNKPSYSHSQFPPAFAHLITYPISPKTYINTIKYSCTTTCSLNARSQLPSPFAEPPLCPFHPPKHHRKGHNTSLWRQWASSSNSKIQRKREKKNLHRTFRKRKAQNTVTGHAEKLSMGASIRAIVQRPHYHHQHERVRDRSWPNTDVAVAVVIVITGSVGGDLCTFTYGVVPQNSQDAHHVRRSWPDTSRLVVVVRWRLLPVATAIDTGRATHSAALSAHRRVAVTNTSIPCTADVIFFRKKKHHQQR